MGSAPNPQDKKKLTKSAFVLHLPKESNASHSGLHPIFQQCRLPSHQRHLRQLLDIGIIGLTCQHVACNDLQIVGHSVLLEHRI